MGVKIMIFAGEQGFKERLRGLIQSDQNAVLTARGIKTPDLRGFKAKQVDRLTGCHILEQDDLAIGKLDSDFTSRFRLIRELKLASLEDHFFAQTNKGPLRRELGIFAVLELIQKPFKAGRIIGRTDKKLDRPCIDTRRKRPPFAFKLLTDDAVFKGHIGTEACEQERGHRDKQPEEGG